MWQSVPFSQTRISGLMWIQFLYLTFFIWDWAIGKSLMGNNLKDCTPTWHISRTDKCRKRYMIHLRSWSFSDWVALIATCFWQNALNYSQDCGSILPLLTYINGFIRLALIDTTFTESLIQLPSWVGTRRTLRPSVLFRSISKQWDMKCIYIFCYLFQALGKTPHPLYLVVFWW